MSPSVNRSSDSPQSSGVQHPEALTVPSQMPTTPTDDSQTVTDSDQSAPDSDQSAPDSDQSADSSEVTLSEVQRQQPIPPPSEPMQYRAIGLIQGQYMPSAEQLTRGTLVASDGTLIDAVLLGRVMSLVKNHISLDKPHLWVVYPRSRQDDGNLHVQIVGVWEPETLNRATSLDVATSEEASEEPQGETPPESSEPQDVSVLKDGYFSIRGEVIYQSKEEEQVIVKIRQAPRRESEKMKFFKLTLKGVIGDRVIGHFWDLHIQLQGNTLAVQQANDIGLLPVKKRPKGKKPFQKRRPGPGGGRKNFSNQRPMRQGDRPSTGTPPKRRDPLPKPVKRGEQRGGGNASGNSTS